MQLCQQRLADPLGLSQGRQDLPPIVCQDIQSVGEPFGCWINHQSISERVLIYVEQRGGISVPPPSLPECSYIRVVSPIALSATTKNAVNFPNAGSVVFAGGWWLVPEKNTGGFSNRVKIFKPIRKFQQNTFEHGGLPIRFQKQLFQQLQRNVSSEQILVLVVPFTKWTFSASVTHVADDACEEAECQFLRPRRVLHPHAQANEELLPQQRRRRLWRINQGRHDVFYQHRSIRFTWPRFAKALPGLIHSFDSVPHLR